MFKCLADSLAVLAVVAAALVCWDPVLPWLREGFIYVSPEGSNWHSGATPDRAVTRIQYAVDLAGPGDTIVIMPGTYRERIYIRHGGMPGNPVTLKAQLPGTVTITGEAEPRIANALVWNDEGGGVFSAETPWPIYRVNGDGLVLLQVKWECVEALRALASREGAWGAFCYDNGRLYVTFPDRKSPAQHRIALHGPVPPRGAWGGWKAANVWLEAGHVRFEGLRFKLGVGSGLRLWKGTNVAVVDCLFDGAVVGIKASSGAERLVGLRVEHCLYHNYPQREWQRRWLTWSEAYASSRACLLVARDDGAIVRGNLVVHASDGMGVSTDDGVIRTGVDVSGNLIAWCTDDAVEFDGFAKKVRFHHNLIYDCHESLGISPVLSGPATIHHNLFLHPADGINGAQVKLLNPWVGRKPPLSGPIRNVTIRDNTFVGNWLCWYADCPVEDVRVERNIFAVQRQRTPAWPDGVTERSNVYIDLPADGYPNPGRDARWFLRRRPREQEGNDAARAGAVPLGGRWTMPRPGPRWLDWRSLPATRQLLDELAPELFAE